MKELLLAGILGFAGHQLENPIERWFEGRDQTKLVSYTAGGLLILLAFIVFAWDLLPPKERLLAILALCAAELGIGSGVTLAHIADGIWEQSR